MERISASWVAITDEPSPLMVYRASPAQGGTRPGLVLVHDAGGPSEHIEDVARRLAKIGYETVAPDMYSRIGRPDPTKIVSLRDKARSLADDQLVTDLATCVRLLRGLPSSSGRVGIWGFSAGGRQALLLACSEAAPVDAVVCCWAGLMYSANYQEERTVNRPVPVVEMLPRLAAPLLLIGAAEDKDPAPAVIEDLRMRLDTAGKHVQARVFDGAGHAFFDDRLAAYRQPAAFELWKVAITFLATHLKAGHGNPET